MTPLYPFQAAAAVAIANAVKPMVNAFDPGLGKTRVAVETLKTKGYRRVLVVCPASALLVWETEIRKWWPAGGPGHLSGHPRIEILGRTRSLPIQGDVVFIISYGRMSQLGADKLIIGLDKFEATILDEVHYLKNPRANRSKNLWKVIPKLGWVHAMSGTPAPNHAGELWGLLYRLRPDLIMSPLNRKPMLEHEFIDRYCEVDRFKVNGHHVEQIKGSKNLEELRSRISPMFLKARKKDVLPELPPLDFTVLPVAVTAPAGLLRYDGLSDDQLLKELAGGAAISELQALGLAKVVPVVEWIEDLLDNDPRRRLCLWAMHHAVIDEYARLLSEYGVAKFDGRDTFLDRKASVDNFMSGKARIFLGQVIAGGTALTLVSDRAPCTDVVFGEASYSPANNFQAACRVHRIGQKDGVLARYAAASGTLDDRVQGILARKSADLVELFG